MEGHEGLLFSGVLTLPARTTGQSQRGAPQGAPGHSMVPTKPRLAPSAFGLKLSVLLHKIATLLGACKTDVTNRGSGNMRCYSRTWAWRWGQGENEGLTVPSGLLGCEGGVRVSLPRRQPAAQRGAATHCKQGQRDVGLSGGGPWQ